MADVVVGGSSAVDGMLLDRAGPRRIKFLFL